MINLRVIIVSQKSFMEPSGTIQNSFFQFNTKIFFNRRTKHFLKTSSYKTNWRPISLLNVDSKLISKSLANRLQDVIPNLISENQSAYINNRFISKGGRLISDILEITDPLQIDGLLMKIDSVNHFFLIFVLKRYGFGDDFIKWIKTLLKNQESFVLNVGKITHYFKLENGTRQGDPISAYLFILVLEIPFILIKTDNNIEGLNKFNHNFLHTVYADDTTFLYKFWNRNHKNV